MRGLHGLLVAQSIKVLLISKIASNHGVPGGCIFLEGRTISFELRKRARPFFTIRKWETAGGREFGERDTWYFMASMELNTPSN